MDPFFAFLASVVKPPWSYWLAGLALVMVVAPRVVQLRTSWLDFRLGRRELELEKGRLELLKLRYEIEAIRKTHNLPDLGSLPAAASGGSREAAASLLRGPVSAAAPAEPETIRSPVVRWLLEHPAVGRPILLLLELGFATFGLITVVAAVGVPFAVFKESVGGAVLAAMIYALFAWGSFVASRRVRRWRKRIGVKPSVLPSS